MSTIGFIGSGKIGGTLARLAVDAGHDVVLSNSRGPDTLRDLVTQLGPQARAATPGEAARAGDVVMVTIPLEVYRDVPVAPLRDTVVIDTMNYYPQRDGNFPELDADRTTVGELLQAHLPESLVVKAFSNIFFKHLPRSAGPPAPPTAAPSPSPVTTPPRRPPSPPSSTPSATTSTTRVPSLTAAGSAPVRRPTTPTSTRTACSPPPAGRPTPPGSPHSSTATDR
ncbi:NADPH-dependent F420 reductase [Micromonospora sp. LOL_021]|uniref:NADPH-dependent F420 reductase n=1 Tax=Micromonospora sp. LOL_021 TaxID=3345417 RepID=UPI003A848398